MGQAGQLDPSLEAAVAELDGLLRKVQEKIKIQGDEGKKLGITFDTLMPALPLPLPGVASRLYQLAWAERFDEGRVEQKLKSLTQAGLAADALTRYDWVFYLPPRSATSAVLQDLLNEGMKAEKMGPFKRAAVHTAVFAFKPVINKAVEAVRKGMMFHAILQAESGWTEDDIKEVAKVYAQELMPDLKPGSGDERRRALAAIERQKKENAEYAKDPYVQPARLATFDPAAYAPGEGEYTAKPPEVTHRFLREGDAFRWIHRNDQPRVLHPAGDRLLVSEDGTMTLRLLVNDTGAVTAVEERGVRRRQTIPRKS